MTRAIEAALVADIQATPLVDDEHGASTLGAELAVEGFPDRAADYVLTHPRGAVLVSFAGRAYERVTPRTVAPRVLRVVCDLTVVARHLRSHGPLLGIYDYLDALEARYAPGRAVTAGPASFTFYALATEFADHDEDGGTWSYAVRLEGLPPAPLEGLDD